MNEKFFSDVKELCYACGMTIDEIAKRHNVNQNHVSVLFLEMIAAILLKTAFDSEAAENLGSEDME